MASKAVLGLGELSVGRILFFRGRWPYHVAFETVDTYVSHVPDLSKSRPIRENMERLTVDDAPEAVQKQVVYSRGSFFRTPLEDIERYGDPVEGLLVPGLNIQRIYQNMLVRRSFERRALQPWEVVSDGGVQDSVPRIVCGTCRYRLAGSYADNCITSVLMAIADGLPRKLQELIYRDRLMHEFSNTQIDKLRPKLLDEFGKPLRLIEDADLDRPISDIVVQGHKDPTKNL